MSFEHFNSEEIGVLRQIIDLTIFSFKITDILNVVDPNSNNAVEQILEESDRLKILHCQQDLQEIDVPRQELEAIAPFLCRPSSDPVGRVTGSGKGEPFQDTQDLIDTVRSWKHFSAEERAAYDKAQFEERKAAWEGPSADAITNPIPIGTSILIKSSWGVWVEATTITPCPNYEHTDWYGDFAAETLFTKQQRGFRVAERGEMWNFLPNGWKWDWVNLDPRPKPDLVMREKVIYCSCGYPFVSTVIEALTDHVDAIWWDVGAGSLSFFKKVQYCPGCNQKLLENYDEFQESQRQRLDKLRDS